MDFSQAPADVLSTIFSFASVSDLGRCAQVSREWRAVSESGALWRKHCESKFGAKGAAALAAREQENGADTFSWKKLLQKWEFGIPAKEDLAAQLSLAKLIPHTYPTYQTETTVRLLLVGPESDNNRTLLHAMHKALDERSSLEMFEPKQDTSTGADGLHRYSYDVTLQASQNSENFRVAVFERQYTFSGRMRRLIPEAMLYKRGDTILVLFSVGSREQFAMLPDSLQKVDAFKATDRKTPVVLLGVDAFGPTRQVPSEEAQRFATMHALPYVEVSLETLENVEYAIAAATHLAKTLHKPKLAVGGTYDDDDDYDGFPGFYQPRVNPPPQPQPQQAGFLSRFFGGLTKTTAPKPAAAPAPSKLPTAKKASGSAAAAPAPSKLPTAKKASGSAAKAKRV